MLTPWATNTGITTGANQGIGFETAKNLLRSPNYHVIIGSRNISNGHEAVKTLQSDPPTKGTISTIQLDVTDDSSVAAAAKTISRDHDHLDILVNNAGIVSTAMPPSPETYRQVLNTNVVSALSVTEAFLELLQKSDENRLVFVSSSVGSISQAADTTSKYYGASAFEYRSSKAALNMVMVLYWNRLQGDGFKVLGADPGLCATNFTGNANALRERGAATSEEGGEGIARVVRGDCDEDVGRVVGEYGVSPW